MGAAGAVVMLLSAGSALLPMWEQQSAAVLLGWLLLVAGLVEAGAGSLRQSVRPFAIAAGLVTVAAGLIFLLNRTSHFVPVVQVIIAWLLLRSIILLFGSRCSHGSARMWMTLSSGTDFVLALLLIAGLSASTLVISLFGPTPELVASFSWVLALSFVVTGALLIEIASCEAASADDD